MSVDANDMPQANIAAIGGEIRQMSYSDLKTVIAIETTAYTHPWTIGIFRDCLRVGYSCWVIEREDDVIGYGIVMLAPGEAHILNICVHPDHQHKGYGRQMLNFLIARASEQDIEMIILEVRRSNTAAIALYDAEGFHELGVRQNYYPSDEGREDAIIFAKYLAKTN